jgi:ABC-2 type transport system permease protein
MAGSNIPAPAPTGAAQPSRYGEVFDRGYARYDGPRLGRRGAYLGLVRYSIKRALGIKKSWTAKIIPILLYAAAFVPVIVMISILAFVPTADVASYPGYFALIFGVEGIFVATIAPEMLCGDRRENVLTLYFSRALKRSDYLIAKILATALLTLTISAPPPILLWLGRQFLADSPLSAMAHHLDDLGKIILVSLAIAFYLGAIGLTVSSFTGRKAVAVGVTIIGFGVSSALAHALWMALENSSQRRFFVFLSPANVVLNFANSLFGVEPSELADFPWSDFSTWGYLAGMAAVVAICLLIMYWRYVPDE